MNTDKTITPKKEMLSLYWKCQLAGWGLVSIYWAYTVYTRDEYGIFYTLLNYVLDASIGIFLTHMYRRFAIRADWSNLPIKKLLLKVVPVVLFLAFLYMELNNLKWHGFMLFFFDKEYVLLTSLLYWDPILITGLRLMSIWVLAYHLYHYYQKEVVTAKENAQLSIIAKQAQLDNLSAQLNPHFLFNSLNSIKSLVIENPSVARRAIDLLSDLLRSSLYEKDKDLISIKEELSLVKDYIELEKMRFEERLQLDITIDKTLNNFKIPTLSIQLLVENAIKHGIDTKIDGGIVHITIAKKSNTIKITVQNPGTLNSTKKTAGLGLKNLQERLAIQYKGNATFTLSSADKETVTAIITLPINNDENI
jgi:hypothetical protein